MFSQEIANPSKRRSVNQRTRSWLRVEHCLGWSLNLNLLRIIIRRRGKISWLHICVCVCVRVTQCRRGLWLQRRWDSWEIEMIASSLCFEIMNWILFWNFISFQWIFVISNIPNACLILSTILFLNHVKNLPIYFYEVSTRRELEIHKILLLRIKYRLY